MVYALLVHEADGMVSRSEVRDRLDERLRSPFTPAGQPDRDTWGLGREAAQSQQRLDAMFGGPSSGMGGVVARPKERPD